MTDPVIEKAANFLQENFSREVTLDELAAHTMYSKFYLLRRFKAVMGVTPGKFLTAVRLAHGERMLVDDPV